MSHELHYPYLLMTLLILDMVFLMEEKFYSTHTDTVTRNLDICKYVWHISKMCMLFFKRQESILLY